jgi:ATP synthase protein I
MSQEPRSPMEMVHALSAKVQRKIRAQRATAPGVWMGLGMMGLVGWSVVVPTLLGAALGVWLDSRYPEGRSWTLALLMGGLALGCLNAWHWVSQEDEAMREQDQDDDV